MYLPATASQMLAMDVLAFDKMSKSNRRKQSKPLRVSYSAENDPASEGGGSIPNRGTSEEVVNGNGIGGNVSESEMEEHAPMGKVNGGSLHLHSQPMKDYDSPDGEKVVSDPKENNNEHFPTKYHRLGSELFAGNAFPENGIAKEEQIVERMDEDGLPKELNPDEEGRKLDGQSRIFHQDAYCELCDREFCNKYFLKTHKANKHGIFDNSLSPFSLGAAGNGMPLPQENNVPSVPITSPVSQSLPQPPISSMSSFKVMDFIQSLPASEPPKTTKMDAMTPTKGDNLPPVSTPLSSISNTQPTASSSSNSTSTPKVSKDMEDFCELCQKHFCNKYYLKKHKQDVHGIAPPDGSGSSSKRGRQKDLQAQLDAITSASVSSNSPLIPHSLPNMTGLPNMPGVMVLNPFMAPMLLPAGSLMPGSQIPTPPIMSQPLPTTSHHESITTTASPGSTSQTSPGSTQKDSNSNNQEAYCELCCKEFCNKYFLKVHKANKHGIFMEDFPFLPGMPGMPGMPPFKFPLSEGMMSAPPEKPLASMAAMDSRSQIKSEPSPKHGTSLVSSSSPENSVTYCGLCNQEFASKYTYRIHRIQVHGMLNEGLDGSLTEEIIRNSFREREEFFRYAMREKEEASKISPGSKNENEKDGETKMADNGMTTMFGNMVAAKLADRVTCDICNKDLCNKYFLKVHKFKVHGVDTSATDNKFDPSRIAKHQLTGDFELIKNAVKQEPKDMPSQSPKHVSKLDKIKDFPQFSPKMSSFMPMPMPMPMLSRPGDMPRDKPMSPSTNIEKPSNEELVKMGIDPEAYCEICKKEFCSKYFLRTHRLNIHGISTPDIPQSTPGKISPMMFQQANNIPLNLSMNGGMSSGKKKSGFEKHSWRWKEPMNSSRVSCDICNKEVCNKYFLRTHKLNKHGILPSENSLSPSTSDIETQSNSSLPTDLSMHDRMLPSPHTVKLDSNMPGIQGIDEKMMKMGDSPIKMNPEEGYNSEVCHLCDRRFKNQKWLNAHILKDHARAGPFPSEVRERMMNAGMDLCFDKKTCRICEKSFPSELSMHLHMIQEHNAQVSLNTEEKSQPGPKRRSSLTKPRFAMKRGFSFTAKQKLYNCAICDYKSKWLNNVYMHELKEHRVLHVKNKSGVKRFVEKAAKNMKQYRCTKCNLKFATPILCHLHIREEHIRNKNFRVNNKLPNTRLNCKFCPFSTKFSKQLRHHMTRVHCDGRYTSYKDQSSYDLEKNMDVPSDSLSDSCNDNFQLFKIQDCSLESDFCSSMAVKLPVRHRMTNPVTVTFHLAPMEQ
ncbi:uncharacterized protein LOC133200169 [Saccostrea echinata]|uniref:uncharacterized protein LOC133200169 n=1 Tax=Saccostrea echinata TaxID=191078 RepID=UPI002A83AB7A|nr:uncharacterized protein LOC133200169 [Saccostrea echinata]XP_061191922.1 uncharacterized protein LOC133200169 [Saccostrea echinata]XP_061191923.1 uncharacterized protein LOC133200169 [Saccostrea echinata]XP_061191924.1 uncharacterized protein LOC133200169 [Saccostrea echinata]